MMSMSNDAQRWAAARADYLFNEVLPEILRDYEGPPESLEIIFVVSSASVSPVAPKAMQEEHLRRRKQWTDADRERQRAWSNEGVLFENAVLFMLNHGMSVETVLEFLGANQKWNALAVVRGREALEEELADRYCGPGSYCDLFDHASDYRLVIHMKTSVYKAETHI